MLVTWVWVFDDFCMVGWQLSKLYCMRRRKPKQHTTSPRAMQVIHIVVYVHSSTGQNSSQPARKERREHSARKWAQSSTLKLILAGMADFLNRISLSTMYWTGRMTASAGTIMGVRGAQKLTVSSCTMQWVYLVTKSNSGLSYNLLNQIWKVSLLYISNCTFLMMYLALMKSTSILTVPGIMIRLSTFRRRSFISNRQLEGVTMVMRQQMRAELMNWVMTFLVRSEMMVPVLVERFYVAARIHMILERRRLMREVMQLMMVTLSRCWYFLGKWMSCYMKGMTLQSSRQLKAMRVMNSTMKRMRLVQTRVISCSRTKNIMLSHSSTLGFQAACTRTRCFWLKAKWPGWARLCPIMASRQCWQSNTTIAKPMKQGSLASRVGLLLNSRSTLACRSFSRLSSRFTPSRLRFFSSRDAQMCWLKECISFSFWRCSRERQVVSQHTITSRTQFSSNFAKFSQLVLRSKARKAFSSWLRLTSLPSTLALSFSSTCSLTMILKNSFSLFSYEMLWYFFSEQRGMTGTRGMLSTITAYLLSQSWLAQMPSYMRKCHLTLIQKQTMETTTSPISMKATTSYLQKAMASFQDRLTQWLRMQSSSSRQPCLVSSWREQHLALKKTPLAMRTQSKSSTRSSRAITTALTKVKQRVTSLPKGYLKADFSMRSSSLKEGVMLVLEMLRPAQWVQQWLQQQGQEPSLSLARRERTPKLVLCLCMVPMNSTSAGYWQSTSRGGSLAQSSLILGQNSLSDSPRMVELYSDTMLVMAQNIMTAGSLTLKAVALIHLMNKLEELRVYESPSEADSKNCNVLIRFATEYLSEIAPKELQTTDGVIKLTASYQGEKLSHGDKIMVIGRMVGESELEGSVKKISPQAYRYFKEYALLLKNKGEFVKPKPAKNEGDKPRYLTDA